MMLTTILAALCVASPVTELEWFEGPFSNAVGAAARADKPLFVYVWAEGSDYCARTWTETLSTEEAAAELAGAVCFSANAGQARGARLVQRFGVTTLPTMLFLTPGGEIEDAIIGFINVPNFRAEARRILSGDNTVSSLRAAVAAAPDDLQRALDLAVKLDQLGADDEFQAVLDTIRERDPDGRTVVGAQVRLWDVQNEITTAAADAGDPSTYDLAPMLAHVETIGPEPIRFQAWDWLAWQLDQRGERARARAAYEQAWHYIPATSVNDWGFQLIESYWSARDELTASDRAFVLSVATGVVASAEDLREVPPAQRFGMSDEAVEEYVAECLGLLARAQELSSDLAAAAATLARAVELAPKNGELRARLAALRGSAEGSATESSR